MRKISLLSLPVLTVAILLISAQGSSVRAESSGREDYGEYDNWSTQASQASSTSSNNSRASTMGGSSVEAPYSGTVVTTGNNQGNSRRVTDGRGMNNDRVPPQQNENGSAGYFNSDGYYVCQSSPEACEEHKAQVEASCAAQGGDEDACRKQQTDSRVNEIAEKYGIEQKNNTVFDKYQKSHNCSQSRKKFGRLFTGGLWGVDDVNCKIAKELANNKEKKDVLTQMSPEEKEQKRQQLQEEYDNSDSPQGKNYALSQARSFGIELNTEGTSPQADHTTMDIKPQPVQAPAYTKSKHRPNASSTTQASQPSASPSSGGGTSSSSGGSSGGSSGSKCTPGSPCVYYANNGEEYTITNPRVKEGKIDEDGNFVCYNSRYQKISCN